jgi:hypothetical protein
MARTVQQVIADQKVQADADRERNEAGTDMAPYEPGGGDGFGLREKPTGVLRGAAFRFVDGKYFYAGGREALPANTQLVAVGMLTAWQKWVDQELVEIRITRDGEHHVSREALPDDDPTLWPLDKDGKPSDPWADARYVYFVHPVSAAEFTFYTSTWGGRIAVSQLKAQIQTVRRMHPQAVPLVTFASATMPTKHGPRPRPRFDVIEWRNTGGDTVPAIEPPAPSWGRDLDDEIPF